MITTSRLDATNSSFNNVAGNQYIHTTVVSPPPAERSALQPFNDAPIDLLTTHFTGRRTELTFLRETFSTAKSAAPVRCVVYGMPGIGKTNLVLQFAMESFDQGWYSHVLWSSGNTVEKLYKGMAKILDLIGHPERHKAEQDAKLIAVRRWLEDSQGNDHVRWLLVIDNVGRKALGFLREHLPRRNFRGSILFTTRTVDIATALVDVIGPSHRKLEIRVPDMHDTTSLFFSRAGIETDMVTPAKISDAKMLIEAVGSLPLAIVHAASYMKQTHTSVEDLLRLYQSGNKGEMLRWENDLTSYQEQSVMATFEALFAELDLDSSGFLKLLSFLDPERIPLKMLIEGADSLSQREQLLTPRTSQPTHDTLGDSDTCPVGESGNSPHISPKLRPLLTLILSPIQRTEILRKLQGLSLIQSQFLDGQVSLRIHDLVQYMICEWTKREGTYREWLQSAVSLVCSAFTHIQDPRFPQLWPEYETFLPHLRSLNERWNVIHVELAEADIWITRYLICRGRYEEAEAVCKRGVESFENGCGSEHKDTLRAVGMLAWVYYMQGRYSDAEVTGKRVLSERQKSLGSDHYDTLNSMNILALTYSSQGNSTEAEELLKQVLSTHEKNLGPDHRDTLTVMNNLAQVYIDQKRYYDAEQLLKLTLAGREKNLGPDSIDTLTTAHNLALAYKSQSRFAEAEELYTRALLSWEEQLGPDHPHTLSTIFHLAQLYHSQARNSEAEKYFERAFNGCLQQLGSRHPHTSAVAQDLAMLYRLQGRDNEADALLVSLQSD